MSDLTAMISSTALDLPEHRKQALEACLSTSVRPIGMEHLPARDASGVTASLEMVDKADIYIGVYAWRYGWTPEGSDISITEMEFNRAVEGKKEILVFIMDDDHPLKKCDVEVSKAAQRKLEKFKARACKGRVRGKFRSPDDLRAKIIQALADIKDRVNSNTGQPSLFALHQLPPEPPMFTGRERELGDLEAALAKQGNIGAAISASGAGIQGMGGVGKTALATVLAHRLKTQYPDAQIFLNLRGFDPTGRKPMPPAEAMQRVIHFFQPEAKLPESVEELSPIYISVLNDAGRVLLFLDNAANAEQIQPLLPPANCLLLVTSRQQLFMDELAAYHLGCLQPEKSQEFLITTAPRLKGHEEEAAKLCGHLPLALKVFAGIIKSHTLSQPKQLLDEFRDGQTKLDAVDAAFEVSAQHLDASLRKRWYQLAVFFSSFDLHAASEVWEIAAFFDSQEKPTAGDSASKDSIYSDTMQALVNANLVEWNSITDRFRLHNLTRQFCYDKSLSADEAVVHSAVCADLKPAAEHVQALLQIEDEEGFKAGAKALLADFPDIEYEILKDPRAAMALEKVSWKAFRGGMVSAKQHRISRSEADLALAQEIGDRPGEGRAMFNLAIAYADVNSHAKAIVHAEGALSIFEALKDSAATEVRAKLEEWKGKKEK